MSGYKTRQKKLLYDCLIENKDRFIDVGDLDSYMESKGEDVGLTTMYRFLRRLELDNKVRVETRNHTKYYQIILDECEKHFHLKCKGCGKTIHLDCTEFDEVNKHIEDEHNFKLDHNTIIYGTCSDCFYK